MPKKILITSALPYTNNMPHIGNFVGSQLPSDVYARFCRAKYGAENVLFVCGADEHGTPVMVSAKKAGIPVEQYVDELYEAHKKIVKDCNLSYDLFGRTHTDLQTKLVQDLFTRLDGLGYIEERTSIQPYSVDDGIFLADRLIEGTCPKCGYEKARGDQCDKCGELLDPSDLINPYVPETGSRNIEMRETKGLYYAASRMKPKVKEWFEKSSGWSKKAIDDTKKYLSEDIPDSSITRDIPWGIPVNKSGYEDKVFYVWFDAPWGYVSISQAANPNWADWWFGGDDCKYVQFMGKDNIKFHAIFFPGHEMALDQNWKTVDILKAFSFLNFEGTKISKSTGNGIFLDQISDDAPVDCWRYALMASAPETDDTDFTIRRFADIVNKDLNGMLGNFVSRVCKLTEKNFGLNCPSFKDGANKLLNDAFINLAETINKNFADYTNALETCEFRRAIASLRELWAAGNEFIAKTEPWALVKTDKELAGAVLYECFQLIDFYARISAPFIPETAEKMLAIFETKRDFSWPKEYERRIPDGELFAIPDNLFQMIDADKIAEMIAKYTGRES